MKMSRVFLLGMLGIGLSITAAAEGIDPAMPLISIYDVAGGSVPAHAEDRVSLFGYHNFKKLTGDIWGAHAGAFDFKDWNNYVPGEPHQEIVLKYEGKGIVLRSRHRVIEKDPSLVLTSRGIEPLRGRSRADVLGSGDGKYAEKREAFDAIIDHCMAVKEKSDRDYARAIERKKELARERRVRNAKQAAVFVLVLFLVSFLWSGPVLRLMSLFGQREWPVRRWLPALLILSPVGWVSAISLLHVRSWMILMTLAAPILCLVALSRPSNPSAVKRPWVLMVVILVYGTWSTHSALQFLTMTKMPMKGSKQKGDLGSLGSIRSALSIYQSDGQSFPGQLSLLTVDAKYLREIPQLGDKSLSDRILHLPTRRVTNFSSLKSNDGGGWGYVNAPTLPDGSPNSDFGHVFINCTHLDAQGSKRMEEY